MKKKLKTKAYGVPNLELDGTAVDGDHASAEFNTNGEIMHRLEPLVRELQEQARFPYACTTPNHTPLSPPPTKKRKT